MIQRVEGYNQSSNGKQNQRGVNIRFFIIQASSKLPNYSTKAYMTQLNKKIIV